MKNEKNKAIQTSLNLNQSKKNKESSPKKQLNYSFTKEFINTISVNEEDEENNQDNNSNSTLAKSHFGLGNFIKMQEEILGECNEVSSTVLDEKIKRNICAKGIDIRKIKTFVNHNDIDVKDIETNNIIENDDFLKIREIPEISKEEFYKMKDNLLDDNYLEELKTFILDFKYTVNSANPTIAIGSLFPLERLVESGFNNDSDFIDEMIKKFNLYETYVFNYRTIKGDGNCYYRAVMFRYFEILILNKEVSLLRNIIFDMKDSFYSNEITSRKEIKMNTVFKAELPLKIMIIILDLVKKNNIELAHLIFLKSLLICPIFDFGLIFYFRYIIYNYIRENEDKLYLKNFPIKISNLLPSKYETEDGQFLFNSFYQNYVLKMFMDAEKIIIYLTPFILGINLDIIIFEDESDIIKKINYDGKPKYFFDEKIFLINRKNHYELLYTQKDNKNYEALFNKYINNDFLKSSAIINELNKKNNFIKNQNKSMNINKNSNSIKIRNNNSLNVRNNMNVNKNYFKRCNIPDDITEMYQNDNYIKSSNIINNSSNNIKYINKNHNYLRGSYNNNLSIPNKMNEINENTYLRSSYNNNINFRNNINEINDNKNMQEISKPIIRKKNKIKKSMKQQPFNTIEINTKDYSNINKGEKFKKIKNTMDEKNQNMIRFQTMEIISDRNKINFFENENDDEDLEKETMGLTEKKRNIILDESIKNENPSKGVRSVKRVKKKKIISRYNTNNNLLLNEEKPTSSVDEENNNNINNYNYTNSERSKTIIINNQNSNMDTFNKIITKKKIVKRKKRKENENIETYENNANNIKEELSEKRTNTSSNISSKNGENKKNNKGQNTIKLLKKICEKCSDNYKIRKSDKIFFNLCYKCAENEITEQIYEVYLRYLASCLKNEYENEEIKNKFNSLIKNEININEKSVSIENCISQLCIYSPPKKTGFDIIYKNIINEVKQNCCLICYHKLEENTDHQFTIPCGCRFCSYTHFEFYFKDKKPIKKDKEYICYCSYVYEIKDIYSLGQIFLDFSNKFLRKTVIEYLNYILESQCCVCQSKEIFMKRVRYEDNKENDEKTFARYKELKHCFCKSCSEKIKNKEQFECKICNKVHILSIKK